MNAVIVVGGGIIGLSCAWRLAQKGVRVTVFDAGEVGSEASWAAAGMLAPGGECFTDSAFTRMALASLRLYPEFVAALTGENGMAIDYRDSGALEAAYTDEDADELDRRAEAQAALGIPSEAASHPGAVHARFFPCDAVVNPRNVTAALRSACLSRGVRIREHEPVRELPLSEAGIILLTAGAWSSQLCPALPRVFPVRGHLIAYEASGLRVDPILRSRSTYILQRRDGTIIAGTTKENAGFDRSLDEAAVTDIRQRAGRLLPALAGLAPSTCWNGFRPGIEGDEPFIGRIQGTNMIAATGHYRNGILLAPETARMVSELLP